MSTNSLAPVARKLVQKLSTLQPRTTSLESREAIASWIIFNRKKCDGIGDGMVSYISTASGDGGYNDDAAVRLMLLLRILHRVLLSNRPGADDGEGDAWTKSLAMRTRLGEIVISPLWTALATSFVGLDDDATTAMRDEIRTIIDEWKEYDVFCGPTVWEEYKKGWARALKDVATANTTTTTDATDGGNVEEVKTTSDVNAMSEKEVVATTMTTDSNENDALESVDDNINDERSEQQNATTKNEATSSPGKASTAPLRHLERQATVDLDIDFGDVKAAKVEPSQFLEACRVIASIQITRDLGSDAAMNLSSALSGIPQEVEEACNSILLTQQQRKTGDAEDKVPVEMLSKISDEVLDVDIKYARQSLQNYREAIRQQRMARMQCLNLLLQSRCSFGSIEAARAFYGGDDAAGDVNMIAILEKLKKRKEILVDAMALEGLDVEEDEEETKLAKEEEELTPLSWFTGPDLVQVVDDKIVGDEPAGKRVKTS